MAFLIEKQYAPYSKWLGSAFSKLRIAKALSPILRQALLAKTWKTREKWLGKAYSIIAQRHNALRITQPLPPKVSTYYGRPYSVIYGDRFAVAIKKAIKDPQVKRIKTEIGSVDQFTDSTNVIESLALCETLGVVTNN